MAENEHQFVLVSALSVRKHSTVLKCDHNRGGFCLQKLHQRGKPETPGVPGGDSHMTDSWSEQSSLGLGAHLSCSWLDTASNADQASGPAR